MNLIFKDPETLQRMREGPLGPYVDSYAADMHQQGYASLAPVAVISVRTVWKTYSTSMWQWPIALVPLFAKNASLLMYSGTPQRWNYCRPVSTEQ